MYQFIFLLVFLEPLKNIYITKYSYKQLTLQILGSSTNQDSPLNSKPSAPTFPFPTPPFFMPTQGGPPFNNILASMGLLDGPQLASLMSVIGGQNMQDTNSPTQVETPKASGDEL